MRAAQLALEALTQEQLKVLREGKNLPITIEGETITLTPEDVQVERSVHEGVIAANEGLIHYCLWIQRLLTNW